MAKSSVFVVLNRVNPGRMSGEEWHKAASSLLGAPFPPILTQVADEALVGELQDRRRLPIQASESFNRSLQPLANALFSPGSLAASAQVGQPHSKSHAFNLFGMKVRI